MATNAAVLRREVRGGPTVREHEYANRPVLRAVLIAALALGGVQGWVSLKPAPPPRDAGAVPVETITAVQLTLGQAALALRDFGKGGLLSDRFDFESGLSRVRRAIEGLDALATEPAEREALGRAQAVVDRLGLIGKEQIARTEAGGHAMAGDRLQEIARLRDEAALALAAFRDVKASLASAGEADPVARLLRGAAGGAAALLSVCLGAITIWSRLFPA